MYCPVERSEAFSSASNSFEIFAISETSMRSFPSAFIACTSNADLYGSLDMSLLAVWLKRIRVLPKEYSLYGPSLTYVHSVGTWVDKPSWLSAVSPFGTIVQAKLRAIASATLCGDGSTFSFRKLLYSGNSYTPRIITWAICT